MCASLSLCYVIIFSYYIISVINLWPAKPWEKEVHLIVLNEHLYFVVYFKWFKF